MAHPLLLLNRVGQGRVASVMSDQLWLWARGYEGGGPYAELIRRTAHWLMKEPELEEELLKLEAGASPEIKARLQTLSDTPAKLVMTGPDGAKAESDWSLMSPGHYQATLPRQGARPLSRQERQAQRRHAARADASARISRPARDGRQGAAARHRDAGRRLRLGADGTPNMPRMQRVGDRGNARWLGLVSACASATPMRCARPRSRRCCRAWSACCWPALHDARLAARGALSG